jgi:hypothetical protein
MPPTFNMAALMNYFQQQAAQSMQSSDAGPSPLQKGTNTPSESAPDPAISQMSSQGHPGLIGDAFHAMLGSMLGNALGFTPAGAISAGGGTGTPAPSATAPNYAGITASSVFANYGVTSAPAPAPSTGPSSMPNPSFVAGPNGNGPWAAYNYAAANAGTP